MKTNVLIWEAGYEGEIDFRPPNGKKLFALPYYLNQQDINTITWNLEPDTYYTTSSDKIDYVKKQVTPGSIILLHPMYDQTGEALKTIEGILEALTAEGYVTAEGYEFVTVNELQGEG